MSAADPRPAFLPLQQSPAYATAAATCGARVRWLDLGCGRALAVERGAMRLIFRGPVWGAGADAAQKRAALRRAARFAGMTLASPGEALSGFGLVPLVTPVHHALWDLGGDLRAGMAGKWRNRLVRSMPLAGDIVPGGPEAMAVLLEETARLQAGRGYRALPEAFTRALPPSALRLWEWRHRSRIAAAMAFVVHGGSASYHLAWAAPAAREAGVHAVMLERAALALRGEGVAWLDLGSVDSDRAPGLARFKLGTGAALRALGPTVLVLP